MPSLNKENETIYVYIDESGDLGFKKKSSKVFVVAYIITDSPHMLRQRIKRLKKRLRSKRRKNRVKIHEFKFSRDRDMVRRKLLQLLADSDIHVGYIVIDKSSVKEELKRLPNLLYNYLVVHYILHNVIIHYHPRKIVFVIDKSLSKEARRAFDEYFKQKLFWKSIVERGLDPPDHDIRHMDSKEEPCLQAADYLAGAAFSKFEHDNPEYFKIIEKKIVFRNSWGKIEW